VITGIETYHIRRRKRMGRDGNGKHDQRRATVRKRHRLIYGDLPEGVRDPDWTGGNG
jgi:hypothetical protein